MPRPRFQKLDLDRQEQLLAAAAEEFGAHGYERASLNSVLSRAGLSKGVFYYYFDDKSDLFETVVQRIGDSLLGDLDLGLQGLEADSFWPQIEAWTETVMRRLEEHPWIAGLGKLLYQSPSEDRVGSTFHQGLDSSRRWLVSLLGRGQELGVVRDDIPLDLLSVVLFGALESSDRWFAEQWEDLSVEQRAAASTAVLSLARRLVDPVAEGSSEHAEAWRDWAPASRTGDRVSPL